MRAFPVKLPSGMRYWTVLDGDLVIVGDADAYLRHLRFGRDASELTTRSYAGAIALFLRWCARSGRHWHAGVEHLGLFVVWLRHAGPEVSGLHAELGGAGEVLAGPGRAPVRGARRVNAVLSAVRGFVVHARRHRQDWRSRRGGSRWVRRSRPRRRGSDAPSRHPPQTRSRSAPFSSASFALLGAFLLLDT